ncbi:myb/SANT-like DNA-binding domain-containing protein 3 isoform X8 [Hyla sarda]|uniref:myb/SANT-like DNA-binding domain-containing protein 3 isoform X8 n=1 Tax=Hyla sarda TaxID=327740 RepID=UPI0024C3E4EA|nr:myb/SANT-like DNA-binding domain-containing protein 3 isoform X8 [Hyla sarda]
MLGVVVLQQLEVRHPMMESWLHLAPNVDNQKLLNQMFAVPWKMQNNEVLKPAKYFSELEKNVLLALVEKYKYVLECKKSDARTIALKQRTWQALAHEYNSQPSVSLRDFKQLKKCWENIKARTRKIMAHERREKVMRCGLASNSLKEKVASMIPEQIYYVQTQSEEESQYNHDSSNPDMDCKKVNLLDLELLIDEQGKIQTKPYNKAPETDLLCGDGSPSSSVEKENSWLFLYKLNTVVGEEIPPKSRVGASNRTGAFARLCQLCT